jgi:hypothetical protein
MNDHTIPPSVILASAVRLNSLVSRLTRRYVAASPSMSLVPVAPFLAEPVLSEVEGLGMTELFFRSRRTNKEV